VKAGWVTISLGELTEHRPICYGVLKPGPRQDAGVPLLRITDIKENRLDESDIYLITEELSQEFKRSILKGGEVLLSIQGTIGRVAICPEHYSGANISRTIAVIDPDDRIDRSYLRYCLLSMEAELPTGGATRLSLNIGDLRKLQVALPPLEEQKQIVAVLDAAFEGLTRAKENAEANLQNARELLESRAAEVFSQPGNEELSTLGDAIELMTGFAFKSAGYSEDPSDMAMVRGDNIVQGQFRWKNVKRWPQDQCKEFEKFKLEANDVLLAMDRTWVKDGIKFAIVSEQDLPLLLVQRVARLRCLTNLSHVYLGHFIGSKQFEQYVLSIQTGMGVPHISGQQIKDCPIDLPSIEVQSERARELTDLQILTDALETEYTTKLTDIADLRQSLLQKAFAGELT